MTTHLAESILRAVVPGDAGFAIHVVPAPANVPDRSQGIAVFLQIDKKSPTIAIAAFPFPDVVPARRSVRIDSIGRITRHAAGKLHPLDLGKVETLPVAVLKHDHDGAGAALGRGSRARTRTNSQQKDRSHCRTTDELAHESSPVQPPRWA